MLFLLRFLVKAVFEEGISFVLVCEITAYLWTGIQDFPQLT